MNKYITNLKSLSLQTINFVKEGHTGMSISALNLNYAVYLNHLKISKSHPKWVNRDRFVLSAGHGSMSLYGILHFCGLIPLTDIKRYRQEDSLTPGHPEAEPYNYIDASTGPLGQGVANAVGMAIAEKYLANRWKEFPGLIDHHTFCVVGDGDLQEGICYEAMSLAGKLKLEKLIILHDSNKFQIDSSVMMVNNEDLRLRTESQNWYYQKSSNKVEEINECILKAKKQNKPSFIEVDTIIGESTSQAGNNNAHGWAISDEELKFSMSNMGINKFEPFKFDKEIYEHFEAIITKGEIAFDKWTKLCETFKLKNSKEFAIFENNLNGKFLFVDDFKEINDLIKPEAIKQYLKMYFEQISKEHLKDLISLSADLAKSTNVNINNKSFNEDINSNYIMGGIREFALSGIQNGILYHTGLKSIVGTFLSFSDYMKSTIRVGALNKLPSVYIFTHDSYLNGGDGPTHQPFDQLPMLRAIQNVYDFRPADQKELLGSLKLAFSYQQATSVLILAKSATSFISNTNCSLVYRGAYLIQQGSDLTIVASGSEVDLALKSAQIMEEQYNISIKIVSCPSLKLFLEQEGKYINWILESTNGVLAIEASNDNTWYKLNDYISSKISVLQATTYGKSMNGVKLYSQKGFNTQNVINLCKKIIKVL